MRLILVTLVFLNALYFGWSYWQHQNTPKEPVVTTTDIQSERGQELVLLTERLPAATSPAPPPTISPEQARLVPPTMPAPDARICAQLGPYGTAEGGESAVRQLKAVGIEKVMSVPQQTLHTQFWVLLPQAETRRRALQTLRELQARKIDSYLITSGEMKNAISLGLFSRDELAKSVQEKMREVGYPAEIHRKEKLEKAFWVQMSSNQPFEKVREVLNSLVSGQEGIKISNTPCEMFAQSN